MLAPLLDKSNRGLLLDLVVLGGNLLGVTLLQGFFLAVLRQAAANDPGAMVILFGCSVALFVLAPLGASLKRWHYHQRLGGKAANISDGLAGCLFNPIFYFCLVAVIFATVNAFIMQRVFGNREPSGAVFVPSILVGLGLIILHTFLVYRYFSPPRHPPKSAFLRGPASEIIGDACLFVNMLLFQLIWNLLSFAGLAPPSGAVDAVARLVILGFLALLLYFPPRMFYLAEDAGRGRTWLMILLANAPVIVRVLLGSSVPGR
ncbi:MAG: hypothetical protein ABI836_09230 [Gemmatimonadota bacterium]